MQKRAKEKEKKTKDEKKNKDPKKRGKFFYFLSVNKNRRDTRARFPGRKAPKSHLRTASVRKDIPRGRTKDRNAKEPAEKRPLF